MNLNPIINKIISSNLISELVDRTNREDKLLFHGTSRLANVLLISALSRSKNNPLIIVVPTFEEAGYLFPLLELMGWEKCYIYPTEAVSPYSNNQTSNEIIWGQLQVLSEIVHGDDLSRFCIITTDRSFQPHLPPKHIFKDKCIKFSKGFEIDLKELSNSLVTIGYKKQSSVDQEGTWSRRGDIVDIFPVNCELPVRLEFFGNTIEKIREFDPLTQISQETVKESFVAPIGIEPLIKENLTKNNPTLLNQFIEENNLDENQSIGYSRLISQAWERPASLADFLPIDSFIVIEDLSQCLSHSQNWFEHAKDDFLEKKNTTNINLLKNESFILNSSEDTISQLNNFTTVHLNTIATSKDSNNTHEISNRPIPISPNQFGRLSILIKDFQRENNFIFILSAQPSRAVSLLEEHDCHAKFVINPNDNNLIKSLLTDRTPIALKCSTNAQLEGFHLPSLKVVIITDKELFGQQSLFNTSYVRRRKSSANKKIDVKKLHPGDFVVHRNHGIGKYTKMDRITIAGQSRDYLVVEYLDGILRVAADQLGSLKRYRSSTEKSPNINKLGGNTWNSTKERARKNLKKVAIDLIQLYAERDNKTGFAFPPDGPWQLELEDSFPYEPTRDQITAVKEVKMDMEKHKPMDRLICGDVGFGKTEIAIRAIFKAITAGKQIALLAPTTILAQQHWRTLSERFAPYPIKVSLLNRFKTTSEKKTILEDLEKGKIDALVGTHQLLNSKTRFLDLGLLVIDEEQRFGVNQKEKIKSLKKTVDVLTLSATPIPRTLYMSLSGVREMSLITTPPPLRRSIKTNLSHNDNEVIRCAISQELDRGGQVFYVVPRIQGIEELATKIKNMVPKVKLILAHGQMSEGELESSMIAFNAGEADLMLCTTIIESGLDIPRVNTIIIEDSHTFGLSQLYQLRGRVGRSGIQAYAWLFYPDNSKLNESAKQRLKAIQEFTSLGSGYQLSIRDMEIRGVGNLLGIEQSGQMEVIGFELYMELLQEALADIQGQKIPTVEETQIDLPLTAFIPGDYIIDPDEKLAAYRKASDCINERELIELARNFIDRYGPLPKAIETLFEIMKLKIKSRKCGFTRIKLDKPNIILETQMDEPAFKLLRKGLPKHLHGRLIYTKGDITSKVTARGLGILANETQIHQLIEWLKMMEDQLLDSNSR